MPGASQQFTSIGGQAVIEGVMMRSPNFVAVAVRKPNQRIVIRNSPYASILKRIPLLKKPMIRGVVTLVESLIQGMEALSFSAGVAGEGVGEAEGEQLSSWAIAGSMAFAFVMGMGLFVALPHFLTALMLQAKSPLFHFIDGLIKMGILVSYVYLIALMKDIRRVFQYHGAEHKSIYAFEAGEELTVENARRHTTLHPRCGTSFLLFLVLISVAVFSILFPILGLSTLSPVAWINHGLMIFVKIGLMLPVAGLSYEFIKACACRMENPLFRLMIWPGMVLQKLTTREPTDDQLEVALASLKRVLQLEKGGSAEEQIEVAHLSELGRVQANLGEFLE